MKKAIHIFIIFSFFVLSLPLSSVLAQQVEITNPIKYDTFAELIEGILDFIFRIALILTPLLIIIGAFYIITAVGDPEKIKTGKRVIIYTLIGFLIIIIARGLIALVQSIIGVTEP